MNNLGGVRVGIAFHNDPLDANPIYTYLTALAGVSVQRVETKRGRADERSKVDVGTAQINGIDTAGILDPTNPSGPYYGPDSSYGNPLDPVRQAIIELQNPVTLDWSTIFQGFVADWTYDLDPAENFINWQLDLVDALDILDAAEVVPDSAGNTVPQESTGDCFYTGQPVDDRIFAALADAASTLFGVIWPPSKMHIFSGNVYVQGTAYPARTTLLQVIQDAADAEFPGVGVFFAAADGTLTFHGRFARFQADHYTDHGIQIWKAGDAPAFALDAGIAVVATLGFARGKTNLINAALCYPSGIAQADISGQLVASPTSLSTYAPRSISFENLITEGGEADGLNAKQETKEYGRFYVDNFKFPRSRVSQITWKTQTPGGVLPGATAARGPAVWGLIAGGSGRHPIDISDVVYLTTTHPGGGGFRDEALFVESVAYLITMGGGDVSQITVTCDMSPKAYYDIAFHNESTDGVAGGGGGGGGGAPVLAAQFGASFAGLTATFTDESTAGPSGAITGWDLDFGDGSPHGSGPGPWMHTYAASGNETVALVVTGTSPDGTSTVSGTVSVPSNPPPGSFPQILTTAGRNLVDENGHVMPRLKGFNVQPGGNWSAGAYVDMYNAGARNIRTIVFWDDLEPSPGSISAGYITQLDTQIARLQAAGLYTTLCFYYGPNNHSPGWTGGGHTLSTYIAHGQFATQYLAKRYGDVSDPLGAGKYTKAVIGFGINEPTPDSVSNTYLATSLSEQKTMMTWFRAYAPAWIGIIACAYGPSAPLPNILAAGQTSQTFIGAPDDPFSGMGNWLMDMHCYFEGTTTSATRVWDGRNQYGMPNNTATIKADTSSYPPSGLTRSECQNALAAFFAPYVAYCAPGRANVPLMLGETGWKSAFSGGSAYLTDVAAAAAAAGVAIADIWDYNTSTGGDPWASFPGGVEQAAVTAFFAGL